MDSWYRGVFSWPSQAWIDKDESTNIDFSQFEPGDLGIELTDNDHEVELKKMIKQSTAEGKDEPLCLFDMNTVISKYRHWMKCFPRIQPYFAVKVYDDPAVISLLHYLGAGFDCASKMEIDLLVRKLKVDPSKIIYANAIKAPTHLSFAAHNGVTLLTFDCEEELVKIKRLLPDARLVLRLSPKEAGKVEWPLSKKFGCLTQEVPHLFQVAKRLDLNVVGVCFHAGSGIGDHQAYVLNIEKARAAFDEGRKAGFNLTLLDIGGGFYGNKDGEQLLEKMSGPINEAIDKYFPPGSGVSIMSEPGRYFVESGLKLAACVIGKKAVPSLIKKEKEIKNNNHNYQGTKCHDKDDNSDVDFEYYISASAFGILNINIYFDNHDYHPRAHKVDGDKVDCRLSVLWGPSCDSIDKIQPNGFLPEMDIGDWFIFDDVGAYTISVVTTFNGFQPCDKIRRIIYPDVWRSILPATNLAQLDANSHE